MHLPPSGQPICHALRHNPTQKKRRNFVSVTAISKAGPGNITLRRSSAPIVKADQLLFVHFERPDLKQAEQYLRDFGLVVAERSERDLFMRGTGPQPYIYRVTKGPNARFLGFGFSVAAIEDLQKLAKAYGRPIEAAKTPGGGSLVRLQDPHGVTVDILHGFAVSSPLPLRAAI